MMESDVRDNHRRSVYMALASVWFTDDTSQPSGRAEVDRLLFHDELTSSQVLISVSILLAMIMLRWFCGTSSLT